jgi:hypothetical protein
VITADEIAAMIRENQKKGGGKGLGIRRSGAVRGERAGESAKPTERKDAAKKDADKKDAAHSKDQASAK